MRAIKKFIRNVILLIVMLAVAYWTVGYLFQPSFNTTNNTLDVSQQELIDAQTNLRLRLAKHALDSLHSSSDRFTMPISAQEVDPFLRDWLNDTQWPPQVQVVASNFTIQDDLGVLKLATKISQRAKVGLELHFTIAYSKDASTLIFQGKDLYVGKFVVPQSITRWFFSDMTEVHIPLDLADEQLILHDIYFAHSTLLLDLELNTKELQEQLLERLHEVLPPHLKNILQNKSLLKM